MKKIRVTHIIPTDIKGGASLAGYRLHKEFEKNEKLDSIVFVAKKYSDDNRVFVFRNIYSKFIEKILTHINNALGMQYLLSFNWLLLIFNKKFRKSDVFIIRNIHGDYLPFWFPWLLSKFAPVIWRLPDEWAYTGHCSYSYDCVNWKNGCGNCKNLNEYPKLRFDTTKILFRLKKYFYSNKNIYMVGPSRWICNNLRSSPIFVHHDITYIPIGIDTKLFYPSEKFEKFSISFVSFNLDDKRKGGQIIEMILLKLNDYLVENEIFIDLYCIGKKVKIKNFSNIRYIFTGYLNGGKISEFYSKTHLNILPTLADNLPNTILESLSSGSPVVSFDTGGCRDLVIHKKTGYLARYNNISDFVSGIIYFIENREDIQMYANWSRQLVLNDFTMKKQVDSYIKLIEGILCE